MIRTLAAALLCFSGSVLAADPQLLPAPRQLPGPSIAVLDPTVDFIRSDPRAVWQNYGVNSVGLFRPVVIQTPYASFYRDTGTPFDFTYNRPREITPHVVGTPYRPAWQSVPPPPPLGCVPYYFRVSGSGGSLPATTI